MCMWCAGKAALPSRMERFRKSTRFCSMREKSCRVTASAQGVRFLLFSGPPLKEPIAWGGPIVMNTRQELQQAFLELDQGTFVKD